MNQPADPAREIIQLVDGSDRPCGSATRAQMRVQGLLHRVTYMLVFNSIGQVLVQTRTTTKDWYPGRLDLAAGGVVNHGEDYGESARRELMEELGIDRPLSPLFDVYFEDRGREPVTRSWGRAFRCESDGPFELQAEEVAAVRFMDIEDALALDPGQVTPDTRMVLLAYAT